MNKTVAGCGIAGCLFVIICSGAAIFLAPQIWDWTKRSITSHLEEKQAQQREFTEILGRWSPPSADAPKEKLLPERVDSYVRKTLNENSGISELNLVRSGWNASYSSSSTDSIDVFVSKASLQDWNQIQDDAKKAFEKLKNRGWFCSTYSCSFNRYTAGDTDFFLVWNKEWLHVFTAMDLNEHRSFVNDLYKSTSNK